jgi:succinate-acetate transporter protein
MENSAKNVIIVNETLSPTPLGLCAFGMTTILLSLCNAGYIGLTSPIIGMAVFCGGIAILITGLLEWKMNNLFGFVTFGGFAFFWLSFAAILLLPAMGISSAPGPIDMAAFLFVWALLALALVICALRLGSKLLLATLVCLFLLFICLIIANVTGVALFTSLGGYVGIITGFLALYLGVAAVINDVFKESVFPVF